MNVDTGFWILKKFAEYYMKYFYLYFSHFIIVLFMFRYFPLGYTSYRTEKYSDNEIVCNKDKYFFDFLFFLFYFWLFYENLKHKNRWKGLRYIGKVVKVCYRWLRVVVFFFWSTNKLWTFSLISKLLYLRLFIKSCCNIDLLVNLEILFNVLIIKL